MLLRWESPVRSTHGVWALWGDQTGDCASRKAFERVEALGVFGDGIFWIVRPVDDMERGRAMKGGTMDGLGSSQGVCWEGLEATRRPRRPGRGREEPVCIGRNAGKLGPYSSGGFGDLALRAAKLLVPERWRDPTLDLVEGALGQGLHGHWWRAGTSVGCTRYSGDSGWHARKLAYPVQGWDFLMLRVCRFIGGCSGGARRTDAGCWASARGAEAHL